jgi:hypothetical protein
MGRRTSSNRPVSWHARLLSRLREAGESFGERLAACLPEESPVRAWSDRIAIGLLVLGTVLLGAVWLPRLVERADRSESPLSRERTASTVGPTVRFASDPSWLPSDERARIEISIAAELAGASAFDAAALESAAEAASRTGWFTGPVRLLRTSLDEVLVETPLRVPRAAVRSQGRDHLVDLGGVLLPLSWRAGQAPAGMPVFIGVDDRAPDMPGEAWTGGTLGLGFKVLAAISDRAWSQEIAAIDVDGVDRGAPIRLRTRHGGTIVWGSAEEATVSEVPIATRLAYLDRLHTRAGSVEPPIGQAWDLRLDYLASRSAAKAPTNTMVMAAPSPD